MKQADVIVLGSDVDALAAAATLAARLEVVLVDGAAQPGGHLARESFHPGHSTDGLLLDTSGVRRALLEPLGLERFGLAWRDDEPPLLLIGDGATVRWHRDASRAARALASRLPEEVAGLERWQAFHQRVAPLVAELLDEAPPVLARPEPAELLRLAARGWRLRRLGEADLHTLLRAASQAAEDWSVQWFADPLLRVAATAVGLPGSRLGPRAAGTGLLSLLAATARGPAPRGGAPALVEALVACCRERGVELLLGEDPRHILVGAAGVRGLARDSGELAASHVLSCLGPARTRDLLDPREVPPALERAARSWRARGALSVLHVALDHVPSFGPEQDVERVLVVRSLEHLERCADALKHGVLPAEPWLEVRVLAGPPHAPAGHAVLAVHVHGTCRELRSGWDEGARAELTERAWKGLERAVPGLRARALGTQLLTPPDLEGRFALAGGQLFGGDLALDQLWVQRPSLALSRHASGLHGLTLGGASQHPGGAFLCGAGVLAARALLARS